MIDQEHLISMVREQRLLWDKRHKNYRSRWLTKRAWRNVAETLGCTSDEAQSKWKNLRDSFCRELKKNLKKQTDASADQVAEYTGDWVHFEAMLFLQGVIRQRKTTASGRSRNKLTEPTDNIDEQSVVSVMSDSTGLSSNADNADNHTYLQSEFENFPATQRGSNENISIPTDRLLSPDMKLQKHYVASDVPTIIEPENIKQNNIAELYADLERQKVDLLKKEIEFQEDEDMNWFKSILPHLRKLSSYNKFLFRTKVQEMLLNELTKLNSLQPIPSDVQNCSTASSSNTLPS